MTAWQQPKWEGKRWNVVDGSTAQRRQKIEHCWYCGSAHVRNQMTRDHQLPRCRGGKGGDNIVRACAKCNRDKAHRTVEEYRRAIQRRYSLPYPPAFYGECGIGWGGVMLTKTKSANPLLNMARAVVATGV